MNRFTKSLIKILPLRLQIRAVSIFMIARLKDERDKEPLPEQAPFCILIADISMLKLSAFIKCSCTGDLSPLIIAGNPSAEQLNGTWVIVLSQYYECKKDKAVADYVELVAKMRKISLHMTRVAGNVDALSMHYDEEIIKELRADRYCYPFTPSGYLKDLERVKTGEKKQLIDYNRLKSQYDKNYGSKGEKGIHKEEQFYETLAILRKQESYTVPSDMKLAEELTVKDYCLALQRYEKHIDYLQTQNINGKLHR